MKQGHSNVRTKYTEPWPDNPLLAKIPLEGGASVYSVKELPPLALSQEEWKRIGERMGWTHEAKPE